MFSSQRNSEYQFNGTHVFSDISGIADDTLNDHRLILEALSEGITDSGATICDVVIKEFEPAGMTALYLLSESHVSVHTYPEQNSLFVDAFTCGVRCQPQRIIDSLIRAMGDCHSRTSAVQRGLPTGALTSQRVSHPEQMRLAS